MRNHISSRSQPLNQGDFEQFINYVCPKCNIQQDTGYIIISDSTQKTILECNNCHAQFLYDKDFINGKVYDIV